MSDRFQKNRAIDLDNSDLSMPEATTDTRRSIAEERRSLETHFMLAKTQEEQEEIFDRIVEITPAKTMDGSYLINAVLDGPSDRCLRAEIGEKFVIRDEKSKLLIPRDPFAPPNKFHLIFTNRIT